MKKILFSLLTPILFFISYETNAQGHILGFGSMDGGVENQTVGAAPNVSGSTLATGTQQTAYTTAQATSSVGTISSSGARSGNKCIQWTTGSTSNLLWTPTAASTAIQNSTSYVVQFYYTYASGSARAFVIGVNTDGTSGGSTSTTSSLVVSTTYTKASVVVTSGSSSNATRYGMVSFKPSGGSFATPYVLDDIVLYPGTAVDNTAPDAASAVSVAAASSTSLNVNFTAPASGVDGGGYLVVRGTTDPTTTPNVNGIYAIGNSIGSGTVAYIGTNTSFTDAGLSENTTYYYRVYTVDKAFNYSSAATGSGFTGTTPISFSNVKAAQSGNNAMIEWSSLVEIDMQYYEVEKSTDGVLFNNFSTVVAKGKASTYSVLDNNFSSSKDCYYRIKAVEKNGTTKYSQILKLKSNKAGVQSLVVAPNPIKAGQMNLQIMNYETGIYAVKLIDNSGRIVYKKQVSVTDGSNVISLQLSSSVVKGVYQLIMANENTITSKQVVVE